MTAEDCGEFRGAKVLLFIGDRLLVVRRDPRPDIDWPGRLDFPGGGREGHESPEDCAIRETREEIGLELDAASFSWKSVRDSPEGRHWAFASHDEPTRAKQVRLGEEGTGWTLMTPDMVLARRDAIPPLQRMLRRYLSEVQKINVPASRYRDRREWTGPGWVRGLRDR